MKKPSYFQQRENKVATMTPSEIAVAFHRAWSMKEMGYPIEQSWIFERESLPLYTELATTAIAQKKNPIEVIFLFRSEENGQLKYTSPEFQSFASAYNVFTY